MGNAVSSLIFTVRSGEKSVQGDLGRSVTFLAQGVNTAEAYAKTGAWGSKASEQLVSSINNIAASESALGKSARFIKWAQSHVNPIIGVCAVSKVVLADDKEKAFCTEIPGFLGMLAAESKFKKLQQTSNMKNIFKSIEKVGGKKGKFLSALVEGISFAAVSIGGYQLASKVGEYAIEGERALKAKRGVEAMA